MQQFIMFILHNGDYTMPSESKVTDGEDQVMLLITRHRLSAVRGAEQGGQSMQVLQVPDPEPSEP